MATKDGTVGVILYEHDNFNGQHWKYSVGEWPEMTRGGSGDVSSIRVRPGFEVALFSDKDFGSKKYSIWHKKRGKLRGPIILRSTTRDKDGLLTQVGTCSPVTGLCTRRLRGCPPGLGCGWGAFDKKFLEGKTGPLGDFGSDQLRSLIVRRIPLLRDKHLKAKASISLPPGVLPPPGVKAILASRPPSKPFPLVPMASIKVPPITSLPPIANVSIPIPPHIKAKLEPVIKKKYAKGLAFGLGFGIGVPVLVGLIVLIVYLVKKNRR